MPDKKLTDNEIIKALSNMTYGGHYCAKCKYDNGKGEDRCGLKGCKIARYALDLINRLQEDKQNLEIELKAMRGAANSYKTENEELTKEVYFLRASKNLDKSEFDKLKIELELKELELKTAKAETNKDILNFLKNRLCEVKVTSIGCRSEIRALENLFEEKFGEGKPEPLQEDLKEPWKEAIMNTFLGGEGNV